MQNTSKSNQEGNDELEAWMPVAGEKREGFNYSLFFEQFPDAKRHIFRIREIANIQVMREFDIVLQYAQNDGPSQEIPNNVNEPDSDPRFHPLFLVELDTSIIKKYSTNYNLISIDRNYSLIICTIFLTFRGIQSRVKKEMMNSKDGC